MTRPGQLDEPTTGLRPEITPEQFAKLRGVLMNLPAPSLAAFFTFGAGLGAPAGDSYDDRNAFLDALAAQCALGGAAVYAPFGVASAASTSNVTMTVTFDAEPNAAAATNLANYAVPGLTLSGTPVLVGSTVTLTTSAQLAQQYTVTVSSVPRASDAEPLTVASANFNGTAA